MDPSQLWNELINNNLVENNSNEALWTQEMTNYENFGNKDEFQGPDSTFMIATPQYKNLSIEEATYDSEAQLPVLNNRNYEQGTPGTTNKEDQDMAEGGNLENSSFNPSQF